MNKIDKFFKERENLDNRYKEIFFEIPNKLQLRISNKFIELYGLSEKCSICLTMSELHSLRMKLEDLLLDLR